MFHTSTRGDKGFAAEQKNREFKKILFRTKALQKIKGKRLQPNKLIAKVTNNLDNVRSVKYNSTPKEVERTSLIDREYIKLYGFQRIEKVQKDSNRI